MTEYVLHAENSPEELKLRIAELERQLELLQTVMDTLPTPIFYKDSQGVYLGCNTAFETYLGASKAEIIGKTIYDFLPQERADIHHQADRELLNRNEIQVYESTETYPDGSKHTIIFNKAPFFDPNGKLDGLAGIIEDISKRTAIESELRESEERYRELFENASDAIYTHDLAGNYTSANRAALELTGYTIEEVVQLNGRQLMDPEFLALAQEMTRQKLAGGKPTAYELEMITKDGQRVPVEINTTLFYKDGKPVAVQGIARNISARRQAEEIARKQALQEEIIRAQEAALAELSTPFIPISDNVMVMPLIGAMDTRRAQQVLTTLLEGIDAHKAAVAIIDITGVRVIDVQVANALVRAAQAAKLLGAQVVLTGIGPEIAQTLIHLGADLTGIISRSTLQAGIAYAMGQLNQRQRSITRSSLAARGQTPQSPR